MPRDAGTLCAPCSVPGAPRVPLTPRGLCCCCARAQQGCTACCPLSCGFPPPASSPAWGAEQRCLRPHAHTAPLSCSAASGFWGCLRLEARLRAAPRGTATVPAAKGLRLPRGRSRAFHFAHALSLDCNLPMHLYVHSCTHRRVSANINVQEAPLPAMAALLGLRLPMFCFCQALCWWWFCQSLM